MEYFAEWRVRIAKAERERDEALRELRRAAAVIQDYLGYEHSGDPWEEDAREMHEMDIDDYGREGHLERVLKLLESRAELASVLDEPGLLDAVKAAETTIAALILNLNERGVQATNIHLENDGADWCDVEIECADSRTPAFGVGA